MNNQDVLSEIVIKTKYARYYPELERKETTEELFERNKKMMLDKYPALEQEINEVWENYVKTFKVMPSMRSLQYGGLPIFQNQSRLFNCSFLHIKTPKAFSETIFLLLSGCGVGYSVQKHHVRKLPKIKKPTGKRTFLIEDSIIGWAEAVRVLVDSYFEGKREVVFDYDQIRKQGQLLKTSGGRAPGPEPLKIALEKVRKIFNNAIGRKLTTLECHDIQCHLADCVVAGDNRRSAMIALFSFDDEEMLNCKNGAYWEHNPQRGRANNSVIMLRDLPWDKTLTGIWKSFKRNYLQNAITYTKFERIWRIIQNSGTGEPGVFLTDDLEYGGNPCFRGDQRILTDNGYKTFEELKNKEVTFINADGEKVEGKVWCSGVKEIVELTVLQNETEKKIYCTEKHLFKLVDETECIARDLENKTIKGYENQDALVLQVHSTKELSKVYDFSLRDNKHWGVVEGVIAHNCVEISLKDQGFCNLTETNVDDVKTQEELEARVRAAAFIGTLQAGFTKFIYLRDTWEKNAEEEALLGVSLTGLGSGSSLHLDFAKAAEEVKKENIRVAKIIKINPGARLTAIKPSGCQRENTMLITSEGILELKELGNTKGKQWQDCSFTVAQNHKQEQATKFFVNGYDSTLKIGLSSGLDLEATLNHKFQVLVDEKLQWKEVSELKIGDILPYRLGGYEKTTEPPLYQSIYPHNPKATNLRTIKTPTAMNPDLAWLLGLYYGDGSNHKAGIRIAGGFTKKESLEKAKRIAEEQFGIEGLIYEVNTKIDLYLNSRHLICYLRDNGLLKEKSPDIEIPQIIRRSSLESIRAFVDGYAHADGSFKTQSLSFCTTSKKWAQQLVVVLRAIGVDCKLRDMPPTESSWGNMMRYWVSVRSGTLSRSEKTRKETRNIWIQLDNLGLNNFSFDRITSLEESACNTFDIEVPKNHYYLANSYISHNTAACVLKCSSGVHAYHNDYYIRRMRVGKKEGIYKYMLEKIPALVEDLKGAEKTMAVIAIPIKAPEGALTRHEGLVSQLDRVLKMNKEWVAPGHVSGPNKHNVSSTIYIKENEWDYGLKFFWENRAHYTGMSVLPYDGGVYEQTPFEDITKEKYEELTQLLRQVDFSDIHSIKETEDTTNYQQEAACSGGVCSI